MWVVIQLFIDQDSFGVHCWQGFNQEQNCQEVTSSPKQIDPIFKTSKKKISLMLKICVSLKHWLLTSKTIQFSRKLQCKVKQKGLLTINKITDFSEFEYVLLAKTQLENVPAFYDSFFLHILILLGIHNKLLIELSLYFLHHTATGLFFRYHEDESLSSSFCSIEQKVPVNIISSIFDRFLLKNKAIYNYWCN